MACGDPYIVCNEGESSSCSDQMTNPVYSDHGEYYGVQNYLGGHECIPPGKACS